MATYCNTIFVDNQEEYRGLQNSGLIELIENEAVVERLQQKYTVHEFMKKIEGYISQDGVLQDYFIHNTTRSKDMESIYEFRGPFHNEAKKYRGTHHGKDCFERRHSQFLRESN